MINMIKKKWLIIYLALLFVFLKTKIAISANENFMAGAEGAGLSGATLSLKNHWSAFYNQAGLAGLEELSFGIYTERKFNISELSSAAFALALPFENKGVFALSFYHFGFENYYSQQKTALAYARQLSPIVSAGIQFDYFRTHVMGLDNRHILAAETGLIIQLSEIITLGTHIFNPVVRYFDSEFDERMPSVMRMGGSYKFSDKLFLALEVENDLNFSANFKGGIQYQLHENFILQTGINTNPIKNTFGFQLNYEFLRLSFAVEFHQILGMSSHVSIDYY